MNRLKPSCKRLIHALCSCSIVLTSPLTNYRHEGGGDISLDSTSCAGPAIACSFSMRIHADKKHRKPPHYYLGKLSAANPGGMF
jgi:hypothetical protein